MSFLAAFFEKTTLRKFTQVYYLGLHLVLIIMAGLAMPVVLPRDPLSTNHIITFATVGTMMAAYEIFLIFGIGHFFRQVAGVRKWLVLAMLVLPALMLYSAWVHCFRQLFLRTH